MNLAERRARLDRAVAENSVKRGQWIGCLLSQLSPEVERAKIASACPAEVMPKWLAHMTPWIDDAGTVRHWPAVVRRYARLAHRWHVLAAHQWTRLDYRVRAIAVREAMAHTTDQRAIDACQAVVDLCDRAGRGEPVTAKAWAAAAARATWPEASAAAAWAAAARAEDEAAADEAAAWAAARAEEAWAAARAEEAGAAADRIIDATLDAIEAEIARTETAKREVKA